MRIAILFLFLVSCGEESPEIYTTNCPIVEFEEHIGYLSIEGLKDTSYVYWGCVDNNCSAKHIEKYNIRVDSMGEDTLKVCCGTKSNRVDKVNLVVVK